jgi:hypothetical protein
VNHSENDDRAYSHLLTLLSVSAAMVGVCLTAISLVSLFDAHRQLEGIVDDLLAVGALVFSLVTLLSFLGIRTTIRSTWRRFTLVLDILFCTGITMLVVASMVLTFVVI